jgi:hypothetical protein
MLHAMPSGQEHELLQIQRVPAGDPRAGPGVRQPNPPLLDSRPTAAAA